MFTTVWSWSWFLGGSGVSLLHSVEDKAAASSWRIRASGGRARHGSRGWSVHVPWLAGGVATRARRTEQRGEEEADGWARARKRKETSLKFKTKVFPGSKIHQMFTIDR